MGKIKRNAIIMAAGTASRFVPLSAECPKGLLEVNGEILIERQIRQLQEAGIDDITIVVGYKAEMFQYLKTEFGVDIVYNEDYYRYNNTSSIIRVIHKLSNTYICSSDNYFPMNVFQEEPIQSYYSALYAEGLTSEYCLTVDGKDNIVKVEVGGCEGYVPQPVSFCRSGRQGCRVPLQDPADPGQDHVRAGRHLRKGSWRLRDL